MTVTNEQRAKFAAEMIESAARCEKSAAHCRAAIQMELDFKATGACALVSHNFAVCQVDSPSFTLGRNESGEFALNSSAIVSLWTRRDAETLAKRAGASWRVMPYQEWLQTAAPLFEEMAQQIRAAVASMTPVESN